MGSQLELQIEFPTSFSTILLILLDSLGRVWYSLEDVWKNLSMGVLEKSLMTKWWRMSPWSPISNCDASANPGLSDFPFWISTFLPTDFCSNSNPYICTSIHFPRSKLFSVHFSAEKRPKNWKTPSIFRLENSREVGLSRRAPGPGHPGPLAARPPNRSDCSRGGADFECRKTGGAEKIMK